MIQYMDMDYFAYLLTKGHCQWMNSSYNLSNGSNSDQLIIEDYHM